MRYVLITADGPEHRYVANRLDAAVGLDAIVVDEGRPRTRGARLRQLWRRYTVTQFCGRVVLSCLKRIWRDGRCRREELREVLGPECEKFTRPEAVRRVRGIHSPEGLECVRAFDPERLLVYGSGIVKDEVLALSARPPLNMHTGLSPDYRGADCFFWPLHDGRLECLGATVHRVTAEVDGGAIHSVRRARPEPEDGLHAVFARCVVVGTDQFVEVIEDLEREERPGTPQESGVGREFRASMRGLVAELRVRWALRRGLVRRWCAQNPDPANDARADRS